MPSTSNDSFAVAEAVDTLALWLLTALFGVCGGSFIADLVALDIADVCRCARLNVQEKEAEIPLSKQADRHSPVATTVYI